jgi:hypothetical protein
MLIVASGSPETKADEIMANQHEKPTNEIVKGRHEKPSYEITKSQHEKPTFEALKSQHEGPTCESLVSDLTRRIAAIEPTAAEDKWRTVPWRIDLMAARAEAARENKPMFLWLMNGHPMGCT